MAYDSYRDGRDRGDWRGDDRGRYGRGDDRGFFERAGDEVRSWFGDEEAERRRRTDERYDERYDGGSYRERSYGEDRGYRSEPGGYRSYGRSNRDERPVRGQYSGRAPYAAPYDQSDEGRQFDDDGAAGGLGYRAGGYGYDRGRDREAAYRAAYAQRDQGRGRQDDGHHEYRSWRDQQLQSFDRDYDEYRRENRTRFESEFATWRQNRQTQRNSLTSVKEHQEVLGSDGGHVGVVDHVRGDHILLTKTDQAAGGHHHSIPSSWILSVGEKVTLSKTANEAKRLWRDAEERGGLFGDQERSNRDDDRDANLNRSFSGTY